MLIVFSACRTGERHLGEPNETIAAEATVTLVAGGDVLLDRGVRWRAAHEANDAYSFAGFPDLFAGADLALINLEGALTRESVPLAKRYAFRGDPAYAAVLARAGITAATLANNHSYDYGRDALLETARHLTDNGILVVGVGENLEEASQPRYFALNGLTIALLGVVVFPLEALIWRPDLPMPAVAEEETVRRVIGEARERADVVVVTVHWGAEFSPLADGRQRNWARVFREAGADLVLGHHPHVIQPIEQRDGKWVFYSLGNLVFDQKRDDGRRALLARVELTKTGVRRVEVIPVEITHTRPDFASPEVFAVIDRQLRRDAHGVSFFRAEHVLRCLPGESGLD